MALRSALALVVLLGGCHVAAAHDDVAAFRAIRAEHDAHHRLELLAAYAAEHPHGDFAGEVAAERRDRDGPLWNESWRSLDELRFYLAVYPDGLYAEAARARIARLTDVAGARPEDPPEVPSPVMRRLWVGDAMEFWADQLLALHGWGDPISHVARANPDFSSAIGADPAPICSPTECLKHYHSSFTVPSVTAPVPRTIHVYVRMSLGARGRLERIEILLPERGFSRWRELESGALVDDSIATERASAVALAAARTRPALERHAFAASAVTVAPAIVRPVGSLVSTAPPVVLEAWEQNGVRAVVFAASAADSGAAFDGFYVEPIAP